MFSPSITFTCDAILFSYLLFILGYRQFLKPECIGERELTPFYFHTGHVLIAALTTVTRLVPGVRAPLVALTYTAILTAASDLIGLWQHVNVITVHPHLSIGECQMHAMLAVMLALSALNVARIARHLDFNFMGASDKSGKHV